MQFYISYSPVNIVNGKIYVVLVNIVVPDFIFYITNQFGGQ